MAGRLPYSFLTSLNSFFVSPRRSTIVPTQPGWFAEAVHSNNVSLPAYALKSASAAVKLFIVTSHPRANASALGRVRFASTDALIG